MENYVEPTTSLTFTDKIKKLASSIGPGIFIIGYIIGTGSVTSMATSGARYGGAKSRRNG